MAESTSPRFGLHRWTENTDTWSRDEVDGSFAAIETLGMLFLQDVRANRPAAGVAGRTFTVVGDPTAALNGFSYYDTGTAWISMGAAVENGLIKANDPAIVALKTRGATGQTAMLQTWETSAGSVVASMDAAGNLTVGNVNITGSVSGAVPPGAVMMWPDTVAPTGWLLLSGQTLNRTDEPGLFARYGTKYNTGSETASQFTLPNPADLFPIGASSGKALASKGGSATKTITTNNMPNHSHAVSDPGHGHGVNDPGHAHGFGPVGSSGYTTGLKDQAGATSSGDHTTYAAGTGIYLSAAVTGITLQSTGSGTAFDVMNPWQAWNFITKR